MTLNNGNERDSYHTFCLFDVTKIVNLNVYLSLYSCTQCYSRIL